MMEFFAKIAKPFSRQKFSQKSSIMGVPQGPKYNSFFDFRKVNFQMVFRFNNNNGDNDNVNSNNDNSGMYFKHFQFVILALSLNV